MNPRYIVDELTKNGQTKQAVEFVLSEINSEDHEEFFKRIVLFSLSGRTCFFKGARRAASHMSEPLKTETLLEILTAAKVKFNYFHKNYYFESCINTIKCLPTFEREKETLCFFKEITNEYLPDDDIANGFKELIDTFDEKSKIRMFFDYIRKRDIISILCHENSYEAKYLIKILDTELKGELRDRIISLFLRLILKFNQKKSFLFKDDSYTIFSEVLALEKESGYKDKSIFEIAKSNIKKISIGSDFYSNEELTLKLSEFMPKQKAKRFIGFLKKKPIEL